MVKRIPAVSFRPPPARERRRARRLFLLLAGLVLYACAPAPVCTIPEGPGAIRAPGGSPARVLILYQSTYGSTKQYADWIHREIPSAVADIEACPAPDFAPYDVIVFGSPVRAGRIVLAPVIVSSWSAIRDKSLVLYTVSGTPPDHPALRALYNASLPTDIRKGVRHFPLHGRMVHRTLSARDRALVSVGRAIQRDDTLKKFMQEDFDGVRRETLAPLLEHLRSVLRLSRIESGHTPTVPPSRP